MSQVFPVPLALIAATDPTVCAQYALMLRDIARRVDRVLDGRDALVQALRQPPDLLVTEAELSFLSGYALCAELRRDALTAGVPIVIVTGDTTPRAARDAFSGSATIFLPRPIDWIGLHEAAERVLLKSLEVSRRGEHVFSQSS